MMAASPERTHTALSKPRYRIEFQYRPGARWRAVCWNLPPQDVMEVEHKPSADAYAKHILTLGRANPHTPDYKVRVVTVEPIVQS